MDAVASPKMPMEDISVDKKGLDFKMDNMQKNLEKQPSSTMNDVQSGEYFE